MARMPRRRKSSQPGSAPIASSAATTPSPTPEDGEWRSNSVPQIDARPHLEGAASNGGANGFAKRSSSAAISALAQSTVPAWMSTVVMISLIFGGCCSNVFALEAIVKVEPSSGNLITFAQFLLVAAEGLYYHFDSKSPTFLKPMTIPLHRWFIQVVLFFSVSILNNLAFGYHISIPVHIILRSGGSMCTMLIGWLWGKRYSKVQVLSVVILTAGCVVSALGDSKSMGESEHSMSRFLQGLTILFIAQVLSAIMGLYIEATYAKYGSNYREGLFYTHALSLLMFIPFARSIHSQFSTLAKSDPLPKQPYLPETINTIVTLMPRQVLFLGLNAMTQYVCIRGVNILGAIASALTVTIVLNVRKLVSLLLSIWLFGNKLNPVVIVGATVVFLGGFMYGMESQRQSRLKRMEARKKA